MESADASDPDGTAALIKAASLLASYGQTESMEDLELAITMMEHGISVTPQTSPEHSMYLNNMGIALRNRFLRTGSMDDLDRGITMIKQALATTSNDNPHYASYLEALSIALESRFQHTELTDDLDQAIAALNDAIALSPDHPENSDRLNNLSDMLQKRFERKGTIEDLSRAIKLLSLACRSPTLNAFDYSMYHTNLAVALWTRFGTTGQLQDLNDAIVVIEAAIELTFDQHLVRAIRLNGFANMLKDRFEQTGAMEDLNRCIIMNEQAVALVSEVHSNHALYLTNLGNALQIRYEKTRLVDDLGRAITLKEKAVSLTSIDHPEYRSYANDLAVALLRRFERMGSNEELDRAVSMIEGVLKASPNIDIQVVLQLDNLSHVLQSRFERTGSISDLNNAITVLEQVLAMTLDNDPAHTGYLLNLCHALLRRFVHEGSTEDLNRTIRIMDQEMTSMAMDNVSHTMFLNTLGTALQQRYERMESIGDLDRAIMIFDQALAVTQANNPDYGRFLIHLSDALKLRFEKSGSLDDIDRAIATGEQALASTPIDHRDHPGFLNNLSNSLLSRFRRMGAMDDLKRMITMYEQALESTPVDHPYRAIYLTNLGVALEMLFERTKSLDDVERAITRYEQAVSIVTAHSSLRIKAAVSASSLLKHDPYRAWPLLQSAVELLPTLTPRALQQSDQQHNINRYGGITAMAVSVSLNCDQTPYQAIQLLERGRGILASLQLDIRSDISILKGSYPDLAARLDDIRLQLNRPWKPLEEVDLDSNLKHRREMFNQFDALLTEIRNIKGFQRFLLGPSESELKSAAGLGPIVIFNVSEIRGDAFLITSSGIRSIRLLRLNHSDLQAYTERFLNATEATPKNYSWAKQEMINVLEWLWDSVVGPVLDELKFAQTLSERDSWPRIWWVSSGLLNILPIHAAGYHDRAGQSALDRVISSHAPTIRSLLYARERAVVDRSLEIQKMMLVAMSETPERQRLPFTQQEIETLQTLLSSHITTRVIDSPTRAKVLLGLRDHQIVHLSCHGYSSVVDASQSRLLLHDWKTSPLTVSDFTSMDIKISQFAFLSACHSASIRDVRLLDESINLSSAIQLAGYPSVVGTLWRIQDQFTADIVKDVYAWMLNRGKLDTLRSAEGLHWAVRRLRERTMAVPGFNRNVSADPLVWAAYIHLGA